MTKILTSIVDTLNTMAEDTENLYREVDDLDDLTYELTKRTDIMSDIIDEIIDDEDYYDDYDDVDEGEVAPCPKCKESVWFDPDEPDDIYCPFCGEKLLPEYIEENDEYILVIDDSREEDE